MVLESVIEFVFPKRCVGCGSPGTFLCLACKERMDFAEQICPECGEGSPMGWTHKGCKRRLGMDGLIVLYEYGEEVMGKVIEEIKYGFNKKLLENVLEGMVFEVGEKFDFIVPVPLYFYRHNWRGFNQAEELGKVVRSQISDLGLEKVLKRVRNTKPQVTMKNKEERQRNVEGAFVLDDRSCVPDLRGKKILLVDDVFTSGADMKECTKVLKKAGVSVVWGLALAH